MSIDFQVKAGAFEHIKLKKLNRALGASGVLGLFELWAYTAQHAPDGKLPDSDQDIETAANWDGAQGALARALRDIRLIDETNGEFAVHGWQEHNQFLATGNGKRDRPVIDFRLSASFASHPKIKKLLAQLGPEGVVGWLRLLATTCADYPDGTLRGFYIEDIASAGNWQGNGLLFVRTLCDLHLLDPDPRSQLLSELCVDDDVYIPDDDVPLHPFAIHNWIKQQPYRAGFSERSARSKRANEAKRQKAASAAALAAFASSAPSPASTYEQGSTPPLP